MSDTNIEIQQIDQSNLSLRNKYIHLKRILERNCKDITAGEFLQFPTLFSRLVFISQKYELPKSLEWQLQNIRIKSAFLSKSDNNLISPAQYDKAKKALETFTAYLEGKRNIKHDFGQEEHVVPDITDKIRVHVLEIDKKNELLVCRADSLANETIYVKYNVPVINDSFNNTIDKVWPGAQLNLIDVKRDDKYRYIPNIFVIEPDYLIDASAIAECFQSYGSSYLHYFRRKFEPNANTHYILLGNLANFFLDELIYTEKPEELTFQDAFIKSFHSMPFEYTSCPEIRDNAGFKEFMAKAELQFNNIKRVILHDMPANGFNIANCILEPSFFSEKYGFQGRLDLLELSQNPDDVNRIIELKSGKPPYPREDVSKIAPNHETQTVVYRLMIQSVFNKHSRDIYPTILYSAAENAGENMRFAATYKKLEKEIINTRNRIIELEHDLYTGNPQTVSEVFEQLFNIENYGRTPQFFIDKLETFKKVLDNTSSLEKAYFMRFINFISRELYLLKTGDEGYESAMSISALWNTTYEERREALELIDNLTIKEINDSGRDMLICFERLTSSDCVNFREGEICILYPKNKDQDSILTNQILKGTVVEISSQHVLLRFRYKQRNMKFFKSHSHWVVEHDKLDHSYNAMFKSLYSFIAAHPDKKALLLGTRKPESSYQYSGTGESSKKLKQEIVIEKALSAQDCFLIVGPPGTGKTSIFAKKLIERLHADPDKNILVMAYTNRAVDELCSAVCQAFEENEEDCKRYIRIGTEFSCGEPFRHRLLQNIAHEANTRKEISNQIHNTRIFIGTVAAITGKPELFDLKKFDIAIIDEASQILEPQIIGLLPHFDKFIMIGDHKQLSTITLQNKDKSKVTNEILNSVALYDCSESLFERLFRICRKNKWEHAYDILTYHGRMHKEIAALVNEKFYDNLLTPATDRQNEPLQFNRYDAENKYESIIAAKRVAFISVKETDLSGSSDKINHAEAETVIHLAKALLNVYNANNMPFDPQKSIGIITPYRNQIALIRHMLDETGIRELKEITVDTVERYQGSQRDVILLSFCFTRPYQLHYFCNMNRENTVDRKLNVALTRAREQLFLIGNDIILSQNPLYRGLLESLE